MKEEFEAAIAETERQVNAIGILEGADGEDLWGDEAVKAMRIWRARGRAAFEPVLENTLALLSALESAGDIEPQQLAMLLLAYIQAGENAQAVQAARALWPALADDPLVMVCLALALEAEDPAQALELAQGARGQSAPEGCGLCPSPPALAFLEARTAHAAGEYQIARAAIQAAIEAWPDEPRWHALAAAILSGAVHSGTAGEGFVSKTAAVDTGEGPSAKCLWHMQQAVELEPEVGVHHLGLGQIYLQRGDAGRAISALEQAGRLQPELTETWTSLAEVYRRRGEFKKAYSYGRKALEATPEAEDVLLLNAEIAMENDRSRKALEYLQTVLRQNPDHPRATRDLVQVMIELGRHEDAISLLDRALPFFGYPLEMQMQRAHLLREIEGEEAAVVYLRELTERQPDDPDVRATLAEWLAGQGEETLAVEQAQAVLAGDTAALSKGRRSGLHTLIGLQASKDGQLDQAIHQLSKAVAADAGNLEALLALGRAHQDRRELEGALEAFQAAMELTDADYRPYYYAGQVLRDLKDYVQAEKALRQAAQIAPQEILVRRLLGAVTVLNLVHNRHVTMPDV
jgi:tetratricopeptide (TPR) repeat protein